MAAPRDGERAVNVPSNRYNLSGDGPEVLELHDKRRLPRDFRGEIEDSRALRIPDLVIWDYSLAFLAGNQDLVTDSVKIEPAKLRDVRGRVSAVTNRILPAYRATLAAFRSQLPAMSVRSLDAGYEGEATALATGMAARALWLGAEMDRKVRKAVEWCSPCGNVGLHVWPNQEAEKIEVDVVSPYDLLFEPYASRPELARWSAVRKFVRREEAVALFPDARDFLTETSSDDGDGDGPVGTLTQPSDRLEMFWVYFVDGRCGVWCKTQWVYESEFPPWAQPVTLIRWTPLPNRVWGISQIMPALIPQLRYNQLDELLFAIIKIASSPQWIVSRQAHVDRGTLNNKPGQIIEYNDSARPPELRAPPPAPATLWDALALQAAKIEDMMGAHSASMGKRVPNVSSGIGMETLIGQDEANLALSMEEFHDGFAAATKAGLVLWKEYMPSRMLVRIPGFAGRSSVTRAIERIDMSDKPDVVFEPGSMFAVNSRNRDQQLLSLVQYGLPVTAVLDKLSFKVDEHAEFQRMQALYYAQSMLEAMLEGATVEWVQDPSFMEAVEQVFGDFIRSPDFYEGRSELLEAAFAEQQAAAQRDVDAATGGVEVDDDGPVGPATDRLQAMDNIWRLYQDVVLTRAQMLAAGGGPGAMGSPPAPGGGGGGGPRGAAAPGQPGAPDARRGRQHGPAGGSSNGSAESQSAVAFKSGGRRGAP